MQDPLEGWHNPTFISLSVTIKYFLRKNVDGINNSITILFFLDSYNEIVSTTNFAFRVKIEINIFSIIDLQKK